jgi:hypothetical protein
MQKPMNNLEYTSLLSDYTTRNWAGEKVSWNYWEDLRKGEGLNEFLNILCGFALYGIQQFLSVLP